MTLANPSSEVQSGAQRSDVASMRLSVEKHIEQGNALQSGINAALNFTAAIWTRCSELGLVDTTKSTVQFGTVRSDHIPDHEAYFPNGTVVAVKGLVYNTGSSYGGLDGTIDVTNQKGNKISLEFGDGRVLSASVDGRRAITGDGTPETLALIPVINRLAIQYLAAERSDLAVDSTERTTRKLAEF